MSSSYHVLDGQGPCDIRTNLEYTALPGFFVRGRIATKAYAYARVPPLSPAVMWVTVSPVSTKVRVTSTDV